MGRIDVNALELFSCLKKGLSSAAGAAGKLGRTALDQHKSRSKVGASGGDSVENPEIRMYGDERF